MDYQFNSTNIPLMPIDVNSYGNLDPQVQNMYPNPQYNPNNIQQPYPASNTPGVVDGLTVPKSGNKYDIIKSYENVQNLSKITHKRIEQPSTNQYIIPIYGVCEAICLPLYFFLLGLASIIIGIFFSIFSISDSGSQLGILSIIFFVILTFVSICLSCSIVRKIIVDLGDNTLTLTKVCLCTNKCKTYMPKELLSIILEPERGPKGGRHYYLNIYPVNGKKNGECVGGIDDMTEEEVEYFNYYINKHIQLRMVA